MSAEHVDIEQPGHRNQSIHRRNLNRIAEDEIKSSTHAIPDFDSSGRKTFATKARELMDENMRPRTGKEWLGTILPCYKWLSVYDWRTKLFTDVLAGLAVGVMVIPQGMSYAKLAGLPVEYGLYSALFPVWVYSIFGTSCQLAIGPVALVSLLLFTGLTNQMERLGISEDDSNYKKVYATIAIQTSFLVAMTNLLLGILRLGFVTIFLSNAVISGFISGASIIIALSQVKYIFGVSSSGSVIEEILKTLFDSIGGFNWKTFLMGTSSIAFLMGLKHAAKVFPKQKWLRAVGPISITIITIAITWGGNISPKAIPVVGAIPAGFPDFTAGLWTPIQDFGGMLTVTLSITLIGFMESVAIAKKLAAEHKYEIDASQELIGLGLANFVGAMFQAYPVTGSFSRSAVNNSAGAQSGISGAVTATLVALVLLFLTPVFEHMVCLRPADCH
jgi:sulfate transporter 4